MPTEPSPKPPDHWFRDWLTYGGCAWFSRFRAVGQASRLALKAFGQGDEVGDRRVACPTLLAALSRRFRSARLRLGAGQPSLVIALLVAALVPGLPGCRAQPQEVVIYCAQDQVYAEPLFRAFTVETGIKVRPLFDSEAMKTVGLANRLLAERAHPQADVFWGNEELRTRQLAARDVFRATNASAAFGYRSRRLVVNTNLLPLTDAPASLLELTNARWHGKVSLAYPLFGTTATHFMALRQHWGETNWLAWCRALAANQPLLEEGNSGVVKRVGRGAALVGLTDSDDIAASQSEGLPVVALPLTAELLLIPNTVAITRDAPNPEAAQRFFDWLQRPETVRKLVASGALEGASAEEIKTPTLQPDWAAMLRELTASTGQMKEIFLR